MDFLYTLYHLCALLLVIFTVNAVYRISRSTYQFYIPIWQARGFWTWVYFQNTWIERPHLPLTDKHIYTRVFGHGFERTVISKTTN